MSDLPGNAVADLLRLKNIGWIVVCDKGDWHQREFCGRRILNDHQTAVRLNGFCAFDAIVTRPGEDDTDGFFSALAGQAAKAAVNRPVGLLSCWTFPNGEYMIQEFDRLTKGRKINMAWQNAPRGLHFNDGERGDALQDLRQFVWSIFRRVMYDNDCSTEVGRKTRDNGLQRLKTSG